MNNLISWLAHYFELSNIQFGGQTFKIQIIRHHKGRVQIEISVNFKLWISPDLALTDYILFLNMKKKPVRYIKLKKD